MDGLKAALNEDFSCLIVDIMLPGMDGFEICRKDSQRKGCSADHCDSQKRRN